VLADGSVLLSQVPFFSSMGLGMFDSLSIQKKTLGFDLSFCIIELNII
jgi:anti-anti-sigma regulatory factor